MNCPKSATPSSQVELEALPLPIRPAAQPSPVGTAVHFLPAETVAYPLPTSVALQQLPTAVAVPQLPRRTAVPPLPTTVAVPQLTMRTAVPPMPITVAVPQLPTGTAVPPLPSGAGALPKRHESVASSRGNGEKVSTPSSGTGPGRPQHGRQCRSLNRQHTYSSPPGRRAYRMGCGGRRLRRRKRRRWARSCPHEARPLLLAERNSFPRVMFSTYPCTYIHTYQ